MLDETLLTTVFGYTGFRPGQKESVLCLLNKKDCLSILPTGAGKSFIYQYYSCLRSDGLVLVVSPLIALMKDQVDSINSLGITSATINSSQDELDQLKTISRCVQGKVRILLVSPERAVSSGFLKYLSQMKISLLVVDEAHCISQWGHDFRTEYSEIHKIRDTLKSQKFPILALTATATQRVGEDIIKSLDLKSPKVVRGSFLRKNLEFSVKHFEYESEREEELLHILQKFQESPGRGIIYCATRKKTEELYGFLKENGISTGVYHAGKSENHRESIQNSFVSSRTKILISTNAFGMGVDLPDVRIVIHYQMPSSVEAYYQEAGRGGRDGGDSRCILFFKNSDLNVSRFLNRGRDREDKKLLLEEMKKFALSETCRQIELCGYFGEKITRCGKCDNCLKKNSSLKSFLKKETLKLESKRVDESHEFSDEEKEIVFNCLKENQDKFGKKILIGVLRGSKATDILRRKLQTSQNYGKLNYIKEAAISKFIEELIIQGKIKVSKGKYPKLSTPDYIRIRKKSSESKITENGSRNLLKALKNFRDYEARKLKWKKFMVLQNPVLSKIAFVKPQNLDDLYHIKGMGNAKIDRFGEKILEIVRRHG